MRFVMRALRGAPRSARPQSGVASSSRRFPLVSRLALAGIATLAAALPATAQVELAIEAAAGERQAFQGLGISNRGYGALSVAKRQELADLVVRDLKMNINRIWINDAGTKSAQQLVNDFVSQFINTGQVADFAARGVKWTLGCPAAGHTPPADINAYADKIADFYYLVKRDHGFSFQFTSIANEPQNWNADHLIQGLTRLRQALDARPETAAIEIIAPDWASVDDALRTRLDVVRADPIWQRLHGIATHSYGMTANGRVTPIYDGKTWWQTESSDPQQEALGDDIIATRTAGRFLSDMNNLVTHWIYFIGFMNSDNGDSQRGTKLVVYRPELNQNWVFLKYHYLKRLTETFEYGAVFRRATNPTRVRNQAPHMEWRDRYLPATNAAVARNQDGSWGVAVLNLTGMPEDTYHTARLAQDYNLKLTIHELAGAGSVTFNVWRTNAANVKESLGTVTMTNGVLNLSGTRVLRPRDLITLRSAPIGSTSHAKSPLSDATVRDGSFANTSHGGDVSLQIKSGTTPEYTRQAYLKFDTGGLQNAAGAGLNLVVSGVETGVSSSYPVTISVHAAQHDNWTEDGVTWTRRPAPVGPALGTFTVTGAGQQFTVDLTDAVRQSAAQDGRLTLVLRDLGNRNRVISFHSKESTTTGARPILVVTRP
jgi:hypothetical protein